MLSANTHLHVCDVTLVTSFLWQTNYPKLLQNFGFTQKGRIDHKAALQTPKREEPETGTSLVYILSPHDQYNSTNYCRSEDRRKFSPTRRHHNWESIHQSFTLRVTILVSAARARNKDFPVFSDMA